MLKENLNLLMEGIVLQATMDYVKGGRIAKEYLEKGVEDHHERDYEISKAFFNGEQFLSFINGNSDAKNALIEKLDKLIDLPKELTVDEAIKDMISDSKRASKVINDSNYKNKFLNYLSSEARINLSKTGKIKVNVFYLNYRCKMLTNEISDCFITL